LARQRFLSTLALCGSFFALSVIALGAFTRLIDAGLGCPDWPGCYGHFIVPLTDMARQHVNLHYPATPLVVYKAWAEMIHRYFVGGLSIFILVITFSILCKKEYRIRSNVVLASGLLLLLVYQIILGQLTVTLKLLPIIVSQHLLGGFFILSLLWLIYLNNRNTPRKIDNNKFTIILAMALLGFILLLLQIALGAWTSTNYASLSCPDFPFCMNDHPIMSMHFRAAFTFFSSTTINYEGGVLPESVRQTIQIYS
jgi:cytochrome c oxidase assembly protein subunit 15